MLPSLIPLLLALGLFACSTAQSFTLTGTTTSPASRTVPTGTSTASGQAANGTMTLPVNGTTTLSANGTATATVVNGTTLTHTSTSTSAFPTLGGVSPCVVNCLQTSVSQANCSTITDEACFCSSATFRNATANCVLTQCPSELQGAEALAQRFCNLVSVTLTFPSSTTQSSIATSTPVKSGAQHSRRLTAFAVSCLWITLAWHILDW